MENKYEWNENLFRDLLFMGINKDLDIASEEYKQDVHDGFVELLNLYGYEEADMAYLDYKIINNNEHYKVQTNNFITALWFSGVFPEDVELILKATELIIGDKKYKFNKKTKKISVHLLDKE